MLTAVLRASIVGYLAFWTNKHLCPGVSALDALIGLGVNMLPTSVLLHSGPVDESLTSRMQWVRWVFDKGAPELLRTFWTYERSDAMAQVREHEVFVTARRIRVRVFVPPDFSSAAALRPLVLFYHSGGLIFGSPEAESPLASALAAATNAVVASIDYRMAPEATFPASTDDATNAAEAILRNPGLLETAFDPQRFMLFGMSAGSLLSSVVSIELGQKGLHSLCHVLMVPWMGGLDTPSRRAFFHSSVAWNGHLDVWAWSRYLEGVDPASYDWRVSPLFASNETMRAASPGHISYGAYDLLREAAITYAEKLKDVGKLAALNEFPMSHISATHGKAMLDNAIASANRCLSV
eukprot:TRINITY_DN60875_c0_g1_i1.p1 TRINITY_DN60875_c0_g1~~TRINITY_DN60875_c0_g1_i1.p1  ORF type:complete len:351 (+),score=48.39 TRINITY_DN60875_c0_g1_i1:37-1089(+)